jgi:hypothetical protein
VLVIGVIAYFAKPDHIAAVAAIMSAAYALAARGYRWKAG